MLRPALGVWLACGILLFPAMASAAHPQVPGFERFYSEADADAAEGGRLLLAELNCLACHKGELATAGVKSKQAPILDDVGGRVRPEWIQAFLTSPHDVKPGTTMPDVLAALPASERLAAAEALTHFLASTGSVSDTFPDAGAAKKGEKLFQQVGCLACHAPRDDKAAALMTSVALPDLAKKYTSASLQAFLKDPLKSRPSGRMPAFNLKDEDFRAIAHSFVRDVNVAPNLKFAVYDGGWDDLPDFSELKPKSEGECSGFDLTVAGKTNNFAVRFEGWLNIPKTGRFQFFLGSDDGSRLLIDDIEVIKNGGVHPHQVKEGRMPLDAGWHKLVVEYFQGGGEWTLDLEIAGGGINRQPVAGLVSLTKETTDAKPGFVRNAELAEKGKALFSSLGCAACHQLKDGDRKLESQIAAKPLAELKGTTGCLAESPAGQSPRFGLSTVQRSALVAALKQPQRDDAPAAVVHRSLVAFNCYACHKRGEIGGVEPGRDAFFETTMKEMGDEGRIPPALTGVGDKLQADWLKELFQKGADDRQVYMRARMPKFGMGNVGHLIEAFASADLQPDTAPKVEFAEPDYRVKSHGRQLVGGTALSCIKCHDFGQYPAQGIRAVSLTTMTKRLRADWFDRYMRNPQVFRSGTRMPAPWPFGQSTIKNVLGGNVDQQIRAVWLYLEDGDKGAVPAGLVREPIELLPQGSPIVYRNFIEGAGSRAIGVGYPEKASLAWDANDMRLALIWHGAFIDASRHWNGRGAGYEGPLGDHVIPLPQGQPLARLSSANESWPAGKARDAGFRFRGYQFDDKGRPAFRYEWQGLTVEDAIAPLMREGDPYAAFRRTLTVKGTGEPVQFRALSADKIEPQGDGKYLVDGFWTLVVHGSSEAPSIRDSTGKQELLVPLTLKDGGAQIVLEYLW